MFPLRDNIPARHFPIVTIWLIVINAVCFLYEYQLGGHLPQFLAQNGFVAARFLQLQQQNPFGVGHFLPVLSSMFLHGSLLHLFGNMWMLWIFGDNVEDTMGHGRYLFFYLLCGVAAVAVQAWAYPRAVTPMIGASGAISGVLGAYLISYPKARILTFIPVFIFFYMVEIPAFVFLIFWFAVQFIQGYVHLNFGNIAQGGVAWWAHVGGFVAGIALLPLFKLRKRRVRGRRLSL